MLHNIFNKEPNSSIVQVKKGITTEGKEVWMVLDENYSPVPPVYDYLRYLENKNYSPNTIRAYAGNLKFYWQFLKEREFDEVGRAVIKSS